MIIWIVHQYEPEKKLHQVVESIKFIINVYDLKRKLLIMQINNNCVFFKGNESLMAIFCSFEFLSQYQFQPRVIMFYIVFVKLPLQLR